MKEERVSNINDYNSLLSNSYSIRYSAFSFQCFAISH